VSNYLIIHKDGSVIPLDGAYLVDTDNLDETGKALLAEWDETGSDDTARDLTTQGNDLARILGNVGYGSLGYSNCIAFDVAGLRAEFKEKIGQGVWDDDPAMQRASRFTDEELELFGSYILDGDYLWNVYNEEINSNLRPFIKEVLKEELK